VHIHELFCRPWQADQRRFQYSKGFTYDKGIARPAPPQLLVAGSAAAKSAAAAMEAAAAEGRDSGCGPYVPLQYKGAPLWNAKYVIQMQQEAEDKENGPHMLLKRLNSGVLPWTTVVKKGGKEVRDETQSCMCGARQDATMVLLIFFFGATDDGQMEALSGQGQCWSCPGQNLHLVWLLVSSACSRPQARLHMCIVCVKHCRGLRRCFCKLVASRWRLLN
jgi:hypothetical protein